MKVSYYQTSESKIPKTVCLLAEKCFGAGSSTIILCDSEETMDNLDKILWTYAKLQFLPHATSKDPISELQPIYLTTKIESPNNANIFIMVNPSQEAILDVLDNQVFLIETLKRLILVCKQEASLTFDEIITILEKSKISGCEVEFFSQANNEQWQKIR